MRAIRFLCASAVICAGLGLPSAAFAQTQQSAQTLRDEIDQLRRDFDALKQQYGDRLTALEARLAAIQGAQGGAPAAPGALTAQVPAGAEGAGGPSGQLPVYGTAGAAVSGAKVFNP